MMHLLHLLLLLSLLVAVPLTVLLRGGWGWLAVAWIAIAMGVIINAGHQLDAADEAACVRRGGEMLEVRPNGRLCLKRGTVLR